jgi:putative transposase
MYYWRRLSDAQRKEVLRERIGRRLPWHRPPHFDYVGPTTFIISAACFEHKHIVGKTDQRMSEFERELLEACEERSCRIFAWCILTNHYHLLIRTEKIELLRRQIGKITGRTSRRWNLEDEIPGRKVWFNYFDRRMRSDRHYRASVNNIHNNPVHHGYVSMWQECPHSSVHRYLAELGRDEAMRIWREYSLLEYGKGWDD